MLNIHVSIVFNDVIVFENVMFMFSNRKRRIEKLAFDVRNLQIKAGLIDWFRV